MTSEDIEVFADSARRVVTDLWPDATSAEAGDLAALWKAGADHGWFELGSADEWSALLRLVDLLGRVGAPLPVVDGFVAARLFADEPDVSAGIADGTVRVVVAPGNDRGEDDDRVRFVEAAQAATHLLVAPPGRGIAVLRRVGTATPTSGIAVPAWCDVMLGEEAARVVVDAGQADSMIGLLRLGLATRAAGAAARTHELAVEHAKTRRQFGQAIGAFGAVQQRIATLQIACSAAQELIDDAGRQYAQASTGWSLAAACATEYVAATVPEVQLGGLHTLAAIGLHEEHEGPWLFRRVHADVARLALFTAVAGTVADILVETETGLPRPELGAAAEAFRAEVREMIDRHRDTTDVGEPFGDGTAVAADMAERGWLGLGWPEVHGGRDASVAEQVVLHDELRYARVPVVTRQLGAVMLLGGAILRHGNEDQRAEFLPRIRRGEVLFCLGYSEPEAGSDLASLQTRAERDGDHWVINGQKIWTTFGHVASHVWLAVRTDREAKPRHAGITVFLLPMNTAGISVSRHMALSGEVTCSVFYDDVRVPDAMRVGEVNGGWKVITDALAGERVLMGGVAVELNRQFDDLLSLVRTDPEALAGPRGSARRARLGALAVRLQATRLLLARATGASAAGAGAQLDAPMSSVLSSELAEDFGEAMLEFFGPSAALSAGEAGVPGGGAFESGLRMSIKSVVGGGTNDVLRGLISRGLGLPR